jgi:hypothetical protein
MQMACPPACEKPMPDGHRIPTFLLVAALLSLTVSGCLPRTSPAAPTIIYVTATPADVALPTPEPPDQVDAAPAEGDDACAHLLWPLRDGATWTYRLTQPGGTSTIELVADVSEFGVTLRANGQERVLVCGEGTLAGLPPLPPGHPALGDGITANNPSGDLLPAPAALLPLGQPATWDQELEVGGTIPVPVGAEAEAVPISAGKVAIVNETAELETIAVPAGEFLALPVRQDVFFDLEVAQPSGAAQNVIISLSAWAYYAEGVGPVLIQYDGGIASTQDGTWALEPGPTLELVGYNVPDPR